MLQRNPNAPKPLDFEDVEKIARAAVENAVDFNDSELKQQRERSDQYYQGRTGLKTVEGRSKVVVSKVRDTIRGILPSIGRIFNQSDKVVEFYSDDEEDETLCSDATAYCNSVYSKASGYKLTIEATTDALKAKVGIAHVALETKKRVIYTRYRPEDLEAAGLQASEADSELAMVPTIEELQEWRLDPVPGDEFIIDAAATTIDNAYIVGRRRNMRVGDIVAMGYDYETIVNLTSSDDNEDEDALRRGFDRELDEGTLPAVDPTSKYVLFTEIYIRMDVDGDGIAELRKICQGGDNYKLLSNEPANFARFAIYKADLQPHVFFPVSMAEDMAQDQDSQTALLRSIIDNTALVNSPRTVVNEGAVNIDDVKNGEIGAIIRATEMGQIMELTTPFVAGDTLPVLQYLESVAESRSGVTKMSQGLDPNALAGTTRIQANAAVRGGEARIEMMARNIAETGVKDVFLLILRIAIHDLRDTVSVRTPEGFKQVDTRFWHDRISMRTSIGSGDPQAQLQIYNAMLPVQQAIVTQYGMENPICGWVNVRETLASILRLGGVHNVSDYFPFVPEEKLKGIDQQSNQAKEAASKQAQETAQLQLASAKAQMDFVKVEQQKNEMKHATELQKLQQDYEKQIQDLRAEMVTLKSQHDLEMTKIYLEDDRVRDKNDMDFAIDVATLGAKQEQFAATQQRVDEEREANGVEYGSKPEEEDGTETDTGRSEEGGEPEGGAEGNGGIDQG